MKISISALSLFLLSIQLMSQVIPDQSTLMARAPATFQAVFHTSRGDFTVEAIREWSPAGADRLFQLLMTGFYNQNILFRVQKGYVIQFGICDKKEVNSFWDKRPIPDEEVKTANLKGTISYARDGINSRTTQLFINMKDNFKLDSINFNGLRGFSPVARIISGFEVVESFYGEYGFEPANHQDSAMVCGNGYLKQKFPLLDSIIEVRIITQY
ncbi:MAG: peptidylprolyl isomerase [Bacteroidota bacterium]